MDDMEFFNRLRHPAWGILFVPIMLAIGATISPQAFRVVLVIALVIVGTWTFYRTEYAERDFLKTAMAGVGFMVFALLVLAGGHALDLRAKGASVPETRKSDPVPTGDQSSPEPTPPVALQSPAEVAEPVNKKASVPKAITAPKPDRSADTAIIGPVTVNPGSVASFGQQGGQTASTIINNSQNLPSSGNIKDRAMNLGQEIMDNLYRFGWHDTPNRPFHPSREVMFVKKMPVDDSSSKQTMNEWDESRTISFLALFLPRLIEIRNEFAQLHIRDEELERFIKSNESQELVNRQRVASGGKPYYWGPQVMEIERLTESLKNLADQTK